VSVTFVDIEDENDVGQRIDNFLMRRLKGVPKQKIYSILRKGEVRVNSARVKQTYRLQYKDHVRIPPVITRADVPTRLNDETEAVLEASILFEDDDFIAINKPYGFAVHGGSSIASGVVELLRVMRTQPRIELAHRLDRDTSGCLLLCKKRGVLKEVQAAFRERRVKKKYTLIAAGRWPTKVRTVQDRLLRYVTDWGERRVRVDAAGQVARTDFQIEQRTQEATLLQATLHTGRTHQIRVHAQAQGHAILGDTKYGKQGPAADAQRLCLHASRLVVPLGTDRLDLSAPVEATMQQVWQQIQSRHDADATST
jgi:23S rRNA pseudouridine955/2504/2580 synthase